MTAYYVQEENALASADTAHAKQCSGPANTVGDSLRLGLRVGAADNS
jgi:hypothetical protein